MPGDDVAVVRDAPPALLLIAFVLGVLRRL